MSIALSSWGRSIRRHPLFAILGIIGLGIGFTVFLVAWAYVSFERSYERWLPNADQIYLVQEKWRLPGSSPTPSTSTMGGLLEELQADYPGLVGSRFQDTDVTVLHNGQATSEGATLVDPTFLNVVELPLERGDRNALVDPTTMLVSRSVADRYFPGLDPIGRQITIVIQGEERNYQISGILADPPPNTDLHWDMLIKLVPPAPGASDTWYHWGSESVITFLRFPDRTAATQFSEQLGAFVRRHGQHDLGRDADRKLVQSLLPLTDLHLSSGADRTALHVIMIIGGLTLLIAVVNYVNLATARATSRAREVAMRKVVGANRRNLIAQFMGEAMIATALAGVIGLAVAAMAMPVVNAAGGTAAHIILLGADSLLLPLLVTVIVVGVVAGAYPALILSGLPIAPVLASAHGPTQGGATGRLREILVSAQFALGIAFLICTVVLLAQAAHVRNADLGYQRDGLILVQATARDDVPEGRREALMQALRRLPHVTGVTTSDAAPGDENMVTSVSARRTGSEDPAVNINRITIGNGWGAVYRPVLLAGRLLSSQHRADDQALATQTATSNVVLTRGAARVLGYSRPAAAVGNIIEANGSALVVGVIEDVRFYSLHRPVPPTMLIYRSRNITKPLATLRYSGTSADTVIGAARGVWMRMVPQIPFQATPAQTNLDIYYRADRAQARLLAGAAWLAVAIGCIGLWGLAAFTTSRRVKEIGIRKVLGASSRDILILLTWHFLRPVLFANLVAWPLAFIATRRWLAGFDDRISLGPAYFLLTSAIALGLAYITVVTQSLRAARSEPAWALRHE